MAELNIINKSRSVVKLKDIKDGDVFYYRSKKYREIDGYYIKTTRRPESVDNSEKYLIGCTRLSDGLFIALVGSEEISINFKMNINIDYNII